MLGLENNVVIPFKGDYKPLSIYKNNEKIFEPTTIEKSGIQVNFENTYNHEFERISVYGDCSQSPRAISVKQGRLIQFENHLGEYMLVTSPVDCTVTRCGRNLLNLHDKSYVSFYGPEITIERNSMKIFGILNANAFQGHTETIFGDSLEKNIPIVDTNTMRISSASISGDYYIKGQWIQSDNTFHYGLNSTDGTEWLSRVYAQNLQLRAGDDVDIVISDIMISTDADVYEEYIGDEFLIRGNIPAKIPLLDGVNSVFTNQDEELIVQYLSNHSDENNLNSPTPYFNEEITCVSGKLRSYTREKTSELNIPKLNAVKDSSGNIIVQDILYVDRPQQKMWIERNVLDLVLDSTTNFSYGVHINNQPYISIETDNWNIAREYKPISNQYNSSYYSTDDFKIYTPSTKAIVITDSRFTSPETAKELISSTNINVKVALSNSMIEELDYSNLATFANHTEIIYIGELEPKIDFTAIKF